MDEQTGTNGDDVRRRHEAEVLQKYALRWAVLAAWRKELAERWVAVPPDVVGWLEIARIKICSGRFSLCEVGSVLRKIESLLTPVEASSPGEQTDKWLGHLAQAMAEKPAMAPLLQVPAIRINFENDRPRGCGGCE
jgi:hypothetical protein